MPSTSPSGSRNLVYYPLTLLAAAVRRPLPPQPPLQPSTSSTFVLLRLSVHVSALITPALLLSLSQNSSKSAHLCRSDPEPPIWCFQKFRYQPVRHVSLAFPLQTVCRKHRGCFVQQKEGEQRARATRKTNSETFATNTKTRRWRRRRQQRLSVSRH